MKCVFDTNLLISALIIPGSTPNAALRSALVLGTVYTSEDCFEEFTTRIFRKKFDKYFTAVEREAIINLLKPQLEFIIVKNSPERSRDKTDNKFLSVAEAVNADYLITGDNDLLTLTSHGKTHIIRAMDFLALFK